MTFSYDIDLTDNTSLVRFHIGDTKADEYFLDDETISYLVTTHGVNLAVIKSIQYIIGQLSKPDEKALSYSVSYKNALDSYRKLLTEKAQELNVGVSGAVISSTVSKPWRADSYMTNGDQDGAP